MSTRKGKDQSAEQTSPSKEHLPEQVKEVALMLYARRASPLSENAEVNEWQWNSLVWQANELLDKLNEACEEVARQRKAGKRSPGKRFADAKKARNALPDVVPFNEAVMFITRGKHRHVKRAVERFEILPHLSTEELLRQKPATPAVMKKWRKQIADWRKNGMPRNEVLWRRSLYNEKAYGDWHSARKRKHWGGEKIINAAPESLTGFAKEMVDKIGPDSLDILREMGPQREKSDKKRSKAQLESAREKQKRKR